MPLGMGQWRGVRGPGSFMLQPWHWRSRPLHQQTGSQVFAALFYRPDAARPVDRIATLLESPYPLPADCYPATAQANRQIPRYSICAGPPRCVAGQSRLWTPPLGTILPQLSALHHQTPPSLPAAIRHLPFTGGWLGWLGYDLAWEIEQLPQHNADPLPFPVAYWYEPDCFAVLDHQEQQLWLAATDPTQLDSLQEQWETSTVRETPPTFPAIALPSPQFWSTQADYEAAVRQAQQHIRAGDIFQANLSLRFETQTQASGWSIYQTLQAINPSPFASYWHTPWGEVISCSPERLVQLRDRQAQTRPIAGTRSRGATAEQDQAQWQDLTQNRKENAEHVMLVDLERNDLGRVCEWGSVQVNELLTVERYSHVMHLVSNVQGTLKPDQTAIDLIRAVFPGGTITGCPKVRCMEIIEDLEPVRRSLFYGSCGYLDGRGYLDLNILIRTLLLAPSPSNGSGSPTPPCNTVWGQVGAGIVADSDPEQEWQESLQKAQAQLIALGLDPSTPLRLVD